MAHSQVQLAKPNRHTFCAPKPNGLRKALACCLMRTRAMRCVGDCQVHKGPRRNALHESASTNAHLPRAIAWPLKKNSISKRDGCRHALGRCRGLWSTI